VADKKKSEKETKEDITVKESMENSVQPPREPVEPDKTREEKPEKEPAPEQPVEIPSETTEKPAEAVKEDITAEEHKEEPTTQPPVETNHEETKEKIIESAKKEAEEPQEEIPTEQPEEPMESAQPAEEPSQKDETAPKSTEKTDVPPVKKEVEKKGKDVDEDFKYIIRIADTDIDGNKTVVMGLAQIKGIGRHMSVLIVDQAGIDRHIKVGDLTDAQIDKINEVLAQINDLAPGWMVNHRRDLHTGKDIHLISAEVDSHLRDDINLLKMIRSYRGIRHELGLPARGQRTRANGRTGLSIGVSRKRETVKP
jgi:small subunit ribosomal protein S13